MKQMDDMIAKMSDATKKKEATMHLDMSKAEMKKGNEAGCMEHSAQGDGDVSQADLEHETVRSRTDC